MNFDDRDNFEEMDDFDERRAKRKARMRYRQKKRQQMKIVAVTVLAVVALVVLIVVVNLLGKDKDDSDSTAKDVVSTIDKEEEKSDDDTSESQEIEEDTPKYYADITKATSSEFPEVSCEYAVLIDKDEHKIVAQKNYDTRINPASMTKVLTVLVAAEHIDDMSKLKDMCTVTLETTDYCYVNDCSNAGYEVDEQVMVEDLFYGTILPSGADAALTLANYVAGDHEAFVKLMNDKIEELGLSKTTHFTNCVGLYDEKHYTTAYDMAIILEAAMDNELCRKVLSEHIYQTNPTNKHKDGQSLSNLFLRRVEDQEELGDIVVLGAKTGFVNEAGNCCVSCAVAPDGKEYYLCTAKSMGSWPCIYDHAKIYNKFINQETQD